MTSSTPMVKLLDSAMNPLFAFLHCIILMPLWLGMQGIYDFMDLVGRVRTRWAEPGDPSVDR